MNTIPKTTWVQYLLYGVIGIPLAFGSLPLYMHIPKFYVEIAPVSLSLLGLILWIIRLIDAFTDPWFGKISYLFNRHLFIITGLVIFSLMFYALVHPPTTDKISVIIWFTATLTLTSISFSAVSIVYLSWGASLGNNSNQRSYFVLSREAFTLLAVIFASALPVLMSGNLSSNLHYLSLFLFILLALTFAIIFLIPDKPYSHSNQKGDLSILQQLITLWQITSCRWLLIIFLINGIGSAIPATLFFFFVEDVLNEKALSGTFLIIYFLTGIIFSPLWITLSHHFNLVIIWIIAMLIAIFGFSLSAFALPGDVTLFIIVCVISGIALGADLCLPSTMAANLGEKYQLSNILFAWWNMAIKLSLAIAGGLALILLGLMGYQTNAGVDNSFSLKIAYVIVPITIKLLAIVIILYKKNTLTNSKHLPKR